jgi:hypothetical protein
MCFTSPPQPHFAVLLSFLESNRIEATRNGFNAAPVLSCGDLLVAEFTGVRALFFALFKT